MERVECVELPDMATSSTCTNTNGCSKNNPWHFLKLSELKELSCLPLFLIEVVRQKGTITLVKLIPDLILSPRTILSTQLIKFNPLMSKMSLLSCQRSFFILSSLFEQIPGTSRPSLAATILPSRDLYPPVGKSLTSSGLNFPTCHEWVTMRPYRLVCG